MLHEIGPGILAYAGSIDLAPGVTPLAPDMLAAVSDKSVEINNSQAYMGPDVHPITPFLVVRRHSPDPSDTVTRGEQLLVMMRNRDLGAPAFGLSLRGILRAGQSASEALSGWLNHMVDIEIIKRPGDIFYAQLVGLINTPEVGKPSSLGMLMVLDMTTKNVVVASPHIERSGFLFLDQIGHNPTSLEEAKDERRRGITDYIGPRDREIAQFFHRNRVTLTPGQSPSIEPRPRYSH